MSAASGAASEREARTGVDDARVVQACVRVLQAGAGIVRGAAWAHLGRAGRLLTDPRQRRRRHDVENYLPPVRSGIVVVRLRKCEGRGCETWSRRDVGRAAQSGTSLEAP